MDSKPSSDSEPQLLQDSEDGSKPTQHKGVQEGDASRKEVAIYAFGNVESAIAEKFPETLQNILIVVAHVNPMLLGLILGLRTLWDGMMDPIMAHISDNTKSRWGRRRPYVLVGGVSRVLFLVAFISFMPLGSQVTENPHMEAQKFVNDGSDAIGKYFETLVKTSEQIEAADPEIREKMLRMIEGETSQSWITKLIDLFQADEDTSFRTLNAQAQVDVETYLPALRSDLQLRKDRVAQFSSELAALEAQGTAKGDKQLLRVTSQLLTAEDKVKVAEKLIKKGIRAESESIAVEQLALYVLGKYDRTSDAYPATPEIAQTRAAEQMSTAGVDVIDIFTIPEKPAPKPRKAKPPFSGLVEGAKAFLDPGNFEQRTLIIYLLVGFLIFATLSTVNGAPYYALGMELSPSYEGRTQVVVYRSIMNKIAGLMAPWVPVFCFSLYFVTAFDALFWVAVFTCVIGIPSTVLMFFKTRERTNATIKKAGERPSLLRSMWDIGKEPPFLRVLFLFVFIGMTNGLFQQIGFMLNVYWVTGSALSGATLGAQVAMLAWILGLALLPVIKWACDKFQKHRVLQFAIVWMAIGTVLKWWLMDPDHPEYQFILPFFFSIGISAVFNVLPTMMADLTDYDELKYGVRREGMFGAVMAFLIKTIGTIVPLAAGAILVLSGFRSELEYNQDAQTIQNMRMMYSFVPAGMLVLSLFATLRYPLTRERIAEIKAELRARHAAED